MKESAQAQIRHDDHHSEEQSNGIEVDGSAGFFERQHAEPDHQAGAQQRRARAINVIARQLAGCDKQIGQNKDDKGTEG